MDVSIIIVNYNTRDLTTNCIRSIYASKTVYSFEIILVDNASTDDSVSSIRNMFPEVIVIENTQNVGFARANNKAANFARGRYLYILNSDTEIEKDIVEKAVSYGDMNPEVGVIGTKVLLGDGTLQKNYYKFPTLLSELIFFTVAIIKSNDWFIFHLNKYKNYSFSKPLEVDVISGCSMFVKQDVYKKIGLFDKKFFMYYEDVEFCFRVKKSGYASMYFPEGVVKHYHRGSVDKNENDLKLLLSSFQGICIYFSYVKGDFYTRLFKKLCSFLWFNELIILKLMLFLKKEEKILSKINMLRTLSEEEKNIDS